MAYSLIIDSQKHGVYPASFMFDDLGVARYIAERAIKLIANSVTIKKGDEIVEVLTWTDWPATID